MKASFYAPVNHRQQPGSSDAIDARVRQVRGIVAGYSERLPATTWQGARLLELGPGASIGAAVLLACRGARVTVADRYLVQWDDRYHRPFFRALLSDVERRRTEDPQPIRNLLRAGEFLPEVVARIESSAEALGSSDVSFDAVVSHAVLEHLEHVPEALASLANITRFGGTGVHLIHFGDHRDDDRQLEYLTLDRDLFWTMFEMSWGECGNRWRHNDFHEAFTRAGFSITATEPVVTAPMEYVRDVRPRLHPDFADRTDDELRTLVSWFVCERRDVAPALWTPRSSLLPTNRGEVHARALIAGRRLLIYGAGEGSRFAFDALERLGCGDQVVGVCDGDPNKWGLLVRQHQVTGFEHIPRTDYDTVIVASLPGRHAIGSRLREAGLVAVPALDAIGFVAGYQRPAMEQAA